MPGKKIKKIQKRLFSKKNEKIRSTGDLNCKTTENMALGACAATSEENGAPATSDEPAKL